MPTTQLPLEELTRLCICASLSRLDGSTNLSFRPSAGGASPLTSVPSGYQISLETTTTATGTTLTISLSRVDRESGERADCGAVGSLALFRVLRMLTQIHRRTNINRIQNGWWVCALDIAISSDRFSSAGPRRRIGL